jgi:hypothetical protein
MKHTPGPWCTMYDSMIIRGFDGSDVANITAPVQGDINKRHVNARLIAAAPELLSACQSALAMLRDPDADTDEANKLEAILISAIKKASE